MGASRGSSRRCSRRGPSPATPSSAPSSTPPPADHLWSRTFSADDLRALRHLKARAEGELARRGLTDREVKRGRGGIRDIEFAVQLLQLVHGRLDPDLRSPTTLTALAELGTAGYVDEDDASRLADAYRFLRRLEHRLQLHEGTQVYAMPVAEAERTRIARTLGFRDAAEAERRRAARRRPRPAPGHGAGDPRAALLPSAPRGVRRPRTRSCSAGPARSRRG